MAVPVPDFSALATQQGALNSQAINAQNLANRPNQTNASGATSNWGQNPDGTWSQQTSLGGADQSTLDATNQGLLGATSALAAGPTQAWGSTDLTSNLGAMPQVGQYNQPVIDAWNALQKPQLDQQAAARRASLAAQGVTTGSTIGNNAETQISGNYTDAGNKAILAGYTQGNTEYNQALAGRQEGYTENLGQSNLANAIRQAQMSELTGKVSSLGAERTSLINPTFAAIPSSGAAAPTNIYQAGVDSFNAYQGQANAAAAAQTAKNNTTAGYVNTGLGLLGGASGIGGLLSGAGSALSGWFGNSNASGGNTYTGYNDFTGNTGNNSMNNFLTYGSSGD